MVFFIFGSCLASGVVPHFHRCRSFSKMSFNRSLIHRGRSMEVFSASNGRNAAAEFARTVRDKTFAVAQLQSLRFQNEQMSMTHLRFSMIFLDRNCDILGKQQTTCLANLFSRRVWLCRTVKISPSSFSKVRLSMAARRL